MSRKFLGVCNPSVSSGACEEGLGEQALTEVCGAVVEAPFQAGHYVHLPFLEGMQHRHPDPADVGARVRLQAEGDLAGYDRGHKWCSAKLLPRP